MDFTPTTELLLIYYRIGCAIKMQIQEIVRRLHYENLAKNEVNSFFYDHIRVGNTYVCIKIISVINDVLCAKID